MAAFGHNFPDFRAIWLGRSKYSNFYVKPRQPMTNEGVLDRFRTFRAVKLQPIWSYRYERCLISTKRTCHKMRKLASFQFRQLWEGIISLMFVSRTKTRVLRTRVDLCYHCGPFPACVCEVFNHLSVRTLFSRTFEEIYRYTKFRTIFSIGIRVLNLVLNLVVHFNISKFCTAALSITLTIIILAGICAFRWLN
jgi:hypothetical protein